MATNQIKESKPDQEMINEKGSPEMAPKPEFKTCRTCGQSFNPTANGSQSCIAHLGTISPLQIRMGTKHFA